MTQPVTINHDARTITFQIGKLIPPTEARANYHRLLDLALDALAMKTDLPEEAVVAHTGTWPDGDPRNSMGLAESFRKAPDAS